MHLYIYLQECNRWSCDIFRLGNPWSCNAPDVLTWSVEKWKEIVILAFVQLQPEPFTNSQILQRGRDRKIQFYFLNTEVFSAADVVKNTERTAMVKLSRLEMKPRSRASSYPRNNSQDKRKIEKGR